MPITPSNKSKPLAHPSKDSDGSTAIVGNVPVTHYGLSLGSLNTTNNDIKPSTVLPVVGSYRATQSGANPCAINVAHSLIGLSSRVKGKSSSLPGYAAMYTGTPADPPTHNGDKLVPYSTRNANRTNC